MASDTHPKKNYKRGRVIARKLARKARASDPSLGRSKKGAIVGFFGGGCFFCSDSTLYCENTSFLLVSNLLDSGCDQQMHFRRISQKPSCGFGELRRKMARKKGCAPSTDSCDVRAISLLIWSFTHYLDIILNVAGESCVTGGVTW